jgi:type IV pilus assembly protein PilM
MNFDIFKPKTPPLFGLDISSSSVKMLEIVESGKGFVVERHAIEPLPKDAVVDGNINNLEAVADAVKRGHKRLGTRTKHVAMAVPSEANECWPSARVPTALRSRATCTRMRISR